MSLPVFIDFQWYYEFNSKTGRLVNSRINIFPHNDFLP